MSTVPAAASAQRRYARWLAWGTVPGLVLLVVCLAAYVAGLPPASMPIADLPAYWSQPAAELLARGGLRPGWGWARLLPQSDALVLAAIAWLASCSIACLAAIVPIFAARGERAFLAIAIAQIAVLVLAASGLLAGAH